MARRDRLCATSRGAPALHGGEIVREAGSGVSAQAQGTPRRLGHRGRPRERTRDPRAPARGHARIPMQGEESGGADRLTAPGWSIRSTAPRTSSTGSPPSASRSPSWRTAARSRACVHAPFLGETYVAARGEGAWCERDDERPHPPRGSATGPRRRPSSPPASRSAARSSLPRYLAAFGAAPSRPSRTSAAPAPPASTWRGWPAASSTASSSSRLAPWDVAAGGLLIEEAGGVVTDWTGRPRLARRRHPRGPAPGARGAVAHRDEHRPRLTRIGSAPREPPVAERATRRARPEPAAVEGRRCLPAPCVPDEEGPGREPRGLRRAAMSCERYSSVRRPPPSIRSACSRVSPTSAGSPARRPRRPPASSRWRCEPVLGDRLGLDPHLHVPVAGHARAGRDQLADDHVLLQAEQRVRLGRRWPRR